MTNKITKELLFTELSIKIATLEMKLDKVLELLNKLEVTTNHPLLRRCFGQSLEDVVNDFNNTPPQWPNESHTDYLKRIGQYNEASVSDTPQSDDEKFMEDYK